MQLEWYCILHRDYVCLLWGWNRIFKVLFRLNSCFEVFNYHRFLGESVNTSIFFRLDVIANQMVGWTSFVFRCIVCFWKPYRWFLEHPKWLLLRSANYNILLLTTKLWSPTARGTKSLDSWNELTDLFDKVKCKNTKSLVPDASSN